MKKLRPLLILAAGCILGWAIANRIAHRNFEQFKSTWDPEVKAVYEESVAFQTMLTQEEMEQMRQDIRYYAQHSVEEFQMMPLWQGVLAVQIQGLLEAGNTNHVDIVLTRAISQFKEQHAKGTFKGTEFEKTANALWSSVTEPTAAPATEEAQ